MSQSQTLRASSKEEVEFERVGSVLVAMRKQFGTSEMQILGCMVSDAGLANRATLPEAAVYCAAKFK